MTSSRCVNCRQQADLLEMRWNDNSATHDTPSPFSPSSKRTMERLLRATINTWNGLIAATRSEEAFRQELVAFALALPLAFFVAVSAWKRLALLGVVGFGLVVVRVIP